MLKKSIVAAILLSLAVSFTIGSIGNVVNNTAYESSTHIMYGPMPPGHDGRTYTQVFVDMRESGDSVSGVVSVHAWQPPDTAPQRPFFMFRPHGGEFIEGKMMVIPAGEDMPQTFPVFFFKHTGPGEMGRVSYIADTTFNVDDSVLSFAGEIRLLNDTIVTTDIADVYNNEIMPGQTNWHQAYVSGSPAAFNFDLKWNSPDNPLRVVVYTPDGKVLGPYYDDSDGSTDGRINMEISSPAGVADGAWSLKVTDTGVTGKDEYYLKTW